MLLSVVATSTNAHCVCVQTRVFQSGSLPTAADVSTDVVRRHTL